MEQRKNEDQWQQLKADIEKVIESIFVGEYKSGIFSTIAGIVRRAYKLEKETRKNNDTDE